MKQSIDVSTNARAPEKKRISDWVDDDGGWVANFRPQTPLLLSALIGVTLRTCVTKLEQESPAIADKPARRESLPKLLQFGVPTTLSLTILA